MSEETTKRPNAPRPESELLSPAEAAHFLGVTPELLFSYAVHPPKQAIGDKVTLTHMSKAGRSGFLRSDLESFDKYLRAPWSEAGAPRPPLPSYIGDYLKVECGGQCARCGRGYKLENAHIVPYAESRSHHHHNVIRLCVECHEEFHTKRLIPYDEIYELKQRLIARIREHLVTCMNPTGSGLGRMPNPASQFVGREHDLGVLVEALSQYHCLSIEGPGGIGKTQLLLNALQLSFDPRPVLWMNIEAYNNVYELQLALASVLSEPGSLVATNSIADVLADSEVRLVFDGVEQMSPADMDEVEDFFGTLLAMTSAAQLIFTSQVELINLDLDIRLQLNPISEEASLFFLQSVLASELLSTADETKGMRSLVDFCQGHPLTLKIIVGLLQYFGSASAVMKRIQQSGSAAIQNPTRHRQNTHTSLCACLLVSYQTLTLGQRRMLWIASQCPAGFLTDMLEDLAEYGIEDNVADIAALRHWHLVDVDVNTPFGTRLYVLSPIRAFVKSEFQDEKPHEIEELEYFLVTDLNTQAEFLDRNYMQVGDVALGLHLFSMELPNFMHALRVSADRTSERSLNQAALMAGSLMVYCFVSGFLPLGIEIMKTGADAATRIGNKHKASELLVRLLAFAQRSFETDVVRTVAAELNRLAEGSSDPFLIANAATGRGDLAMMEKRVDAAGEAFAEAEVEYEKVVQLMTSKLAQTSEDEAASWCGYSDWATHLLAMNLKSQGDVHERCRRPTEAIHCYERALTLVREKQDQINVGSILHHIGNCAAESNQGEKGFDSYLAAAKKFQSVQFEEFLSNSLTELGYLLVGWDPPSSVDDLLPEELIVDGLYDVARQVEKSFIMLASVLPSEYHVQTVRKVFGITALASFSSKNHLLSGWAYDLREEVLRPLLSIEAEWGEPVFPKKMLLMHLDLTLAVAGTLSAVEQPKAMGPFPTNAEIEHFARLCYNYFEPGWAKFHPFEWLATYLRRHRGTPPIQPDVLRSAAEEAVTSGHNFSVVL